MTISFIKEKIWPSYVKVLDLLKDLFLLIIRLYWGWSFFQAGLGKFKNFDKTVEFFTSLGLPMPEMQVTMAASTELIGGLLLLVGIFSRIAPLFLVFTMCVAYGTAHREELSALTTDPEKFFGAPPFLFLYAALIVLLFGAGKFSLDYLIWGRKKI